MTTEIIKTIKGRRYRYQQSSKRVGGKVKTTSKYIGPVDGRKRRFKISWAATLMGGLAFGAHLAKYGTKSPRYKDKLRPPDPRSWGAQLAYERRRFAEKLEKATSERPGDPYASVRRNSGHAQREREALERINAASKSSAPAKNFTVDEEIEAREEQLERAVDEYNAGTQAAFATEAPADAPAPSPDAPSQPSEPSSDAGPSSSGGPR
jgi:hypothetical protein